MPLKPEKKTLILFAMLLAILVSCDPSRVSDENTILEKSVWNANNKLKFSVIIPDITRRYNVYLKVRNGTEYPYSNLFLFLTTVTPGGQISRDTLELTLADYDGRWLGSGTGSVKFSKFMLQQGIRFSQKGKYTFELEQAMRVRELKGIRDIGFRIERQ
jgi:gliding motility-associated lipoprotein GldH